MSRGTAKGVVVVVALATLALASGCSSARARANRTRVLEAEIIDTNQRYEAAKSQLADANSSADEANAQLQQERFEKEELARRVDSTNGQVQQLVSRASSAETRAEVAQRRASEVESRYNDLLRKSIEQRKRTAKLLAEVRGRRARPAPVTDAFREEDPALGKMKADLVSRMSAAGVHMPVEIRTARDGARRVAVVLPDAFKPGKASLAYNPTAVNAIVRLGQLVKQQYADSRISVEGHTDADRIRKSHWASNEALSLARANEVRKLLTDTGLDTSHIATAGLGASQPLERGSTARAKSRNRRVEIFIEPR